MRPPRRLLLPGLALALLGALWLCSRVLDSSGGESLSFLGTGEALAGAGDALEPGASGLESTPEEDGVGRQEIPTTAEPGPSEEELAAAEAAAGSRLSGTVIRLGGTPVEGAEVLLRAAQSWIAIPAGVEEMSAMPSTGPRYEEVTDAEGVFVLRGVPPGDLAVSIRAEGFAPLTRDRLSVPVHEAYDLGSFQLELGIRVGGQVTGPRGHGVEGTQVLSAVSPDAGYLRLELAGYGIPLDRTDADGQFEVNTLTPGSWHLIFDHPAYRVTEKKGVTEPAGRTEQGLRISLDPGLPIEGRVEGLDPIADGPLRVTARLDREQPSGAADEVQGAERFRPRHGEVLADGSFAVLGLAPGVRYKLRLERPRDSSDEPEGTPDRWSSVRGVDDVQETAGAKGVVLTYRSESSVAMKVVDAATGKALERFVVYVTGGRVGNGGLLEGEDGEVRTHFPGGKVLYEGLRPSEKGSSLVIRVRAQGYEDFRKEGVMLWPGKPVDLGEVGLEEAAIVTVAVVDATTGKPISGAHVLASRAVDSKAIGDWTDRGDQRSWANTKVRDAICDEKGIARVTVWANAVCTIKAFADGYLAGEEERSVPPHEAKVETGLTGGARAIVLVIDGEGEPVPGVRVEHSVVGGRQRGGRNRGQVFSLGYAGQADPENETDDTGRVVFENLEQGKHRFAVSKRRNPWDRRGEPAGPGAQGELFLESGGEGELELRVPTRGGFRARLLESGDPLAGALARLQPIQQEEERYGFGWFGGGQEDPRTRVSDHAGRVHFAGLEVGRYQLLITHPERRMTIAREVELVREPIEQVIDVGLATIAGRIVDPQGDPIRGVNISVSSTDQRRMYDGGDYRVRVTEDAEGDADWDFEQTRQWSITSDRNGEYVLRGVLPEAPLRVHVSHRYVVGKNAPAGPLGRDEYLADFDFVLDRAGALRVRVPGLGRNDRRRIEVRAELRIDGARKSQRNARIRGYRPETTMNSISPGHWKVRLFIDQSKEALRETDVDVVEGRTAEVVFHL